MSVSMAQIVIRNIDAAVVDALRQRAAATGTSMEEEARRAMDERGRAGS
jgi:plasmid stability protein